MEGLRRLGLGLGSRLRLGPLDIRSPVTLPLVAVRDGVWQLLGTRLRLPLVILTLDEARDEGPVIDPGDIAWDDRFLWLGLLRLLLRLEIAGDRREPLEIQLSRQKGEVLRPPPRLDVAGRQRPEEEGVATADRHRLIGDRYLQATDGLGVVGTPGPYVAGRPMPTERHAIGGGHSPRDPGLSRDEVLAEVADDEGHGVPCGLLPRAY